MRVSHFEHFKPFCPVCSTAERRSCLTLQPGATADGHVLDGWMNCRNPGCLCEFPIIDGVPILVPDPATYINSQYQSLIRRTDLPVTLDDAMIECQGSGAWDDAIRQHINGSAWDHWGEFDPLESSAEKPGMIASIVKHAISIHRSARMHSVIDVGCALGRSTFELARSSSGLVLGVDIHAGMIKRAAQVLRTGRLSYQRRSCGMLYDRREFNVPVSDCADRVDFWIMNAAHPCIDNQSVDCVNMLNVIDCTPSPLDLLRSSANLVAAGGVMIIATPFDWSPTVTQPHAWIGGHSPRGYFQGKSDQILKSILTPGAHQVSIDGFSVVAESHAVPWQVRIHDRAIMKYTLYMVIARRTG